MKSLNIVAHPDDDLLFLNPDLSDDDEAYIVYMTNGDDGSPEEYIKHKQNSILKLYESYPRRKIHFLGIPSNSHRNGDSYGALYTSFIEKNANYKYITDQLRYLISACDPDVIRTHDPDVEPSIDHDEPHLDHIDHIYTAKYVQETLATYLPFYPLYAYMGYPIRYKEDNISVKDRQTKEEWWTLYQKLEPEVAGEQWDVALGRCYRRRIR